VESPDQLSARAADTQANLAVPWYRSLYGRVALSYAVLLPILLAAQAAAVITLANQRESIDGRERLERAQVARHLALMVSDRLEQTPGAALPDLVAGLQPAARLFVVMKDGDVLDRRGVDKAMLDGFVAGLRESDQFQGDWANSVYGVAPITSAGQVVGMVGITPRSMFERYGGTIVALGTGLLFAGNLALALLVVRPIRARLRNLHAAAAKLRDGDLDARTTVRGTDELAEVSRVFNEMATELSSRTNELETSDRLRRQLVADVSHELITPLTSVLARLETLGMDDVDLTQAQRSAQVDGAMYEARRLERLIGDLLASVRLESHVTALTLEEMSIRDLLSEVAARHEPECRARGVQLSRVATTQTLVGDRLRLGQALDNLVVNALRHTPSGGRIELKAELVGEIVRITVWDSAGSITAEHLPYVFDRFYKVESANGMASPGSGLGLSIVKAIVVRHGGHVSTASSPQEGTTFTIELPRLAQDEATRVVH
jgi:signal transduction histidine kinase